MRPISLIVLMLLCVAAAGGSARAESAFAAWQDLHTPGAVVSFQSAAAFLAENPDWPDEKMIRLNAEAAAWRESVRGEAAQRFCRSARPISGRGKFACWRVLNEAERAERRDWPVDAWVHGDFTDDEEAQIRREFAPLLPRPAQDARAARLMLEHKTAAARRMQGLVSAHSSQVLAAWLQLQARPGRFNAILRKLPAAIAQDPVLLFARAERAQHSGQPLAGAQLLAQVPADAPEPTLWWPLRAVAVRDALLARNPALALRIVRRHGTLDSEEQADALWLTGWICLRERQYAAALQEFEALYRAVATPVSKARAAYWAAQASRKLGKSKETGEWLARASAYPTVFYGQLALAERQARLSLPGSQDLPADADLAGDPRLQGLRALRGDPEAWTRYVRQLAARMQTPAAFAALARLATESGGAYGGVLVAKQAIRQAILLTDAGWPQPPLPGNLRIEPALALAISRQESEFNPSARSPANARGLMQVLPVTARLVARRHDLAYGDHSLENPADNLRIGSAYLGDLIRGFDGSYILAIASYNAGPATVRQWLRQLGPLPRDVDGAVHWIESIPYGETRNYVQRVLENLQVYRALAEEGSALRLRDDLAR